MYTFRFFFTEHAPVEVTGVTSVKFNANGTRTVTGDAILSTAFPLYGEYHLSGKGTSDIVNGDHLYHIEVTKEG